MQDTGITLHPINHNSTTVRGNMEPQQRLALESRQKVRGECAHYANEFGVPIERIGFRPTNTGRNVQFFVTAPLAMGRTHIGTVGVENFRDKWLTKRSESFALAKQGEARLNHLANVEQWRGSPSRNGMRF